MNDASRLPSFRIAIGRTGKYWRLVAITLLVIPSISLLYRSIYFIWSEPPLILACAALTALLLGLTRVPITASAFLLAGAASLAWSLAPGHTLLNIIWEALYLATLAATCGRRVFLLLNAVLLLLGLEQTLLLDIFGLTQHFSGSVHYLAGAQGLLFLPICLASALRHKSDSARALYLLAAGLSLFLVLNSGSRAVYLPLVLILPFMGWRLWRERNKWTQLLTVIVVPVLVVVALTWALPGNPIGRAAGLRIAATTTTLQAGTDPASPYAPSGEPVVEEDGIRSRLKMWDQTVRIGLARPLGTGAGTFREVIHSFQLYPTIAFSSAHNLFLETFATGGWPRLLLLLALIIPALLKGWRGERWPYALGSAALWATMCFDITAQIPSMMALAFASVGPLYDFSHGERGLMRHLQIGVAGAAFAVSLAVVVWWYWPCEGVDCTTGRHLGLRPEIRSELSQMEPERRRDLAEQAVRLNPVSLWAWEELYEATVDTNDRLDLAEEMTVRFPRASSQLYLRWAESALDLGRPDEAEAAIRTGLEYFPPDLRPAGIPLVSTGRQHSMWLGRAAEILNEVNENVQ